MSKRLFPDEMAEQLKECAGRTYRPSNGTEGAWFEVTWCGECVNEPRCLIPGEARMFHEKHPCYPRQWRYGKDGQPQCTAFKQKGGDA
jgi:hypothetical protein